MSFLLVTFAVKEESRPFEKLAAGRSDLRVLLTGIGQRNAEKRIRETLSEQSPKLVLTCGFAGGLNRELATGAVIFSADESSGLSPVLLAAGARPARFHCAGSVATSREKKEELRRITGADAIEMESGIVRAACRERNIPSATVRVVSDAADEDLPLDFNRLMDADQNLSHLRLGLALLKSPRAVVGLVRLQKRTRAAAEELAAVLANVISDPAAANSPRGRPAPCPSSSRCS